MHGTQQETEPHGAAAHHHAEEPFPRVWLRDAIATYQDDEELRQRWQVGLLTLGLFLFALGLPTRRLFGGGPELVSWTDAGIWFEASLGLMPLAHLFNVIPGISTEQAWFLLSAMSWALTLPVLLSLGAGLGLGRERALLVAFVVLTTPAAWLGATMPGSPGPGLLGGCLLFHALISPWLTEGTPTRDWSVRRLWTLWLGVCLLNVVLVLAWPAVFLASERRRPEKAPTGDETAAPADWRQSKWVDYLGAPAALAAALLLVGWILPTPASGLGLLGRASQVVAGREPLEFASTAMAVIGMLITPGVALAGIWQLLQPAENEHESRPPMWIAWWCLFPLVFQTLLGSPGLSSAAIFVLPTAALGLASWCATWREGLHIRRMVALGALQVAILAGFLLIFSRGDPTATWYRKARVSLTSTDVVLTRHELHRYLVRYRLGLSPVDLNEPVRMRSESERTDWFRDLREQLQAAHDAGHRVVLDVPPGEARGALGAYPLQPRLAAALQAVPVLELGE